jgi:hypothetical protein
MCVFALDIQHSFGKISHDYLFTILRLEYRCYLVGEDQRATLWANPDSLWGTIRLPPQYGSVPFVPATVSQPAGTTTFWHSYWPEESPGLSCGLCRWCDNLLTFAIDFQVLDFIHLFEKASGACVKSNKSQALPIWHWMICDTVLGSSYHPSVKILGAKFWSTIHRSVTSMWTRLTGQVRILARESYPRYPCL